MSMVTCELKLVKSPCIRGTHPIYLFHISIGENLYPLINMQVRDYDYSLAIFFQQNLFQSHPIPNDFQFHSNHAVDRSCIRL